MSEGGDVRENVLYLAAVHAPGTAFYLIFSFIVEQSDASL